VSVYVGEFAPKVNKNPDAPKPRRDGRIPNEFRAARLLGFEAVHFTARWKVAS
jgi:hypothetical protein